MTTNFLTKSLSAVLLSAVSVAGLAGVASAQTREHVLLARQAGVLADAPVAEDTSTAKIVLRWERLRVP